ncbi:unnamed protein product [Didymodactylos carnosus]|uniref:Large ribosomal subunit protein mL43 n=1 Tax=Didymodactylos carnosus TaxID=1234261 RepID=A0A814J6P7_9BILA|nr:unnamed protein product [Didymodactylos carnosus]CAF1232871.1 unnamed protein product [Didymodactylos carnosus]CAF3804602.1 unnamed protein product [Didymodactylos carnosus]CAF4040990.1 unnamed protein product [Didymodactylos carnosus]
MNVLIISIRSSTISQLLKPSCISSSLLSLRQWHNFEEITPAKYVKSNLQNGLGRYVCQLQRLTIKFCKEFRTSFGVRDYIEHDLVTFAKKYPMVAIYLQPRRHRTPTLTAEYLNGCEQNLKITSCSRQQVNWWVHYLLTQQGDSTVRYLKQMHSDSPSTQGIWTPYTNKPLDRILRTYPDDELREIEDPDYLYPSATKQIQQLFDKQQQQEDEEKHV